MLSRSSRTLTKKQSIHGYLHVAMAGHWRLDPCDRTMVARFINFMEHHISILHMNVFITYVHSTRYPIEAIYQKMAKPVITDSTKPAKTLTQLPSNVSVITPDPAKPVKTLAQLPVHAGLAATDPKLNEAIVQAHHPGPKGKTPPRKDYNTIRTEQDKVVEDYLKEMTFLIVALHTKNPRDLDFQEIREKFMLVKNDIPTKIIVASGAVLWKYRAQISSADSRAEAFFLEQDFETDRATVVGDMPNSDNFERFPEVLTKIKLTWHSFTPVEKNLMWNKAKRMLSLFAAYESNRRAMDLYDAEKAMNNAARRKK
jgi:hypothetical protein